MSNKTDMILTYLNLISLVSYFTEWPYECSKKKCKLSFSRNQLTSLQRLQKAQSSLVRETRKKRQNLVWDFILQLPHSRKTLIDTPKLGLPVNFFRLSTAGGFSRPGCTKTIFNLFARRVGEVPHRKATQPNKKQGTTLSKVNLTPNTKTHHPFQNELMKVTWRKSSKQKQANISTSSQLET